MSGSLTEIRFAWPSNSKSSTSTSTDDSSCESSSESNSTQFNYNEMQVIGETELSTNEVTYINGKVYYWLRSQVSQQSILFVEY